MVFGDLAQSLRNNFDTADLDRANKAAKGLFFFGFSIDETCEKNSSRLLVFCLMSCHAQRNSGGPATGSSLIGSVASRIIKLPARGSLPRNESFCLQVSEMRDKQLTQYTRGGAADHMLRANKRIAPQAMERGYEPLGQ
ncbi:MAG: hypothetical protein ACLFVJ_18920 [Persicimonas sp.]